jgi:hypothetical protein
MRNVLLICMCVLVFSGCGNKSDSMTNEEKIAGESEKTWKATRETDASGDKDKITRDEKKETITFWRNGNVKMGNGDQVMTGQWTYEGSNLRLQFTGSNVSENFKVLALEDDEMKLQAGDGSSLTMKPE